MGPKLVESPQAHTAMGGSVSTTDDRQLHYGASRPDNVSLIDLGSEAEVIDLREAAAARVEDPQQLEALDQAYEGLQAENAPFAHPDLRIAVLLPCHNEELAIADVVRGFRAALPLARIYVYDNASTDRTCEVAEEAGAISRQAPLLGKGNVVRRMFAEIDADIYVLADGDDTYDASAAPAMIARLLDGHLDMVVGIRTESDELSDAYRFGHRAGNRALTRAVHWLFGNGSMDMLSGYRVFSRSYVKSFPAASHGFETETEMTVHALDSRLPFDEMPTKYRARREESHSKLRTIPDGIRILKFVLLLCKDYRPLFFFGTWAVLSVCCAVIAGLMGHGELHSWTPMTFWSASFAGLALALALIGVVLDSLGRSRKEMKRMLYLAVANSDRRWEAPREAAYGRPRVRAAQSAETADQHGAERAATLAHDAETGL